MEQFLSFAWIGGVSIFSTLVWRLYVAIETQRKLEKSLATDLENLEIERHELGELIQSQTEIIDAFTHENEQLKQREERHLNTLTQIKADHQTLQEKDAELEKELLQRITEERSLTEQLQTQTRDYKRLQHQLESFEQQQAKQEKERASLQSEFQSVKDEFQKISDQNQLYQKIVHAAKVKIETLKQEKTQLERELQQALSQVVTLEQDYQRSEGTRFERDLPLMSSAQGISEPSLPQFR